ncbi:MAG: HEAT repeat domain-containing protein [Planctomycetota bacterium]|nr:MAG: HEAT repeat domain-containing protein [Planctomycetota bacterium]
MDRRLRRQSERMYPRNVSGGRPRGRSLPRRTWRDRLGWPQLKRALRRAAVVLTIAGWIVVGAYLGRSLPDRYFAQRWEAQLQTASDAEAATLLERLDRLGEEGLPALVRAAGDSRWRVATTAQRLIRERLEEARIRGGATASVFVVRLGKALRDAYPKFAPEQRPAAQRLAEELLDWPIDRRYADPAAWTADCRAVLFDIDRRSASLVGSDRLVSMPSVVEWMRPVEKSGVGEQSLATAETRPTVGDDMAAEPPNRLPEHGENPLRPLETPETAARDATPSEGPSELVRVPGDLAPDRRDMRAPRTSPAAPTEPKRLPTTASSEPLDAVPKTVGGAEYEGDPNSLRYWMERLSYEDDATSRLAEEKLRERGFGPVEIEIARQMYHPSPEIRRDLIRKLATPPPGIDVTTVLQELAQDADPTVRREALVLLATSRDPRLVRFVVQTARGDSDPDVRRIAEQLDASSRHGGR